MSVVAERALVISLSNIGDAIMTTPVIEALHRHWPDIAIDIVAGRRSMAVFEHCPYRGEILLRDKRAGWRGTLDLVRALRRTRYRAVVDLRTDGLAWLLRAGAHFRKSRPAPGLHAVEQHFAAITALVGAAPIPALTVWQSRPPQSSAGSRTLALGPGANWGGKIWPATHFATLGRALAPEFARVVLLGNASDRAIAERLAGEIALPLRNLVAHTTLPEAAAELARADMFVGNDSGLGHLAAAVGTPTVTIFGPGDPARYRPYHSRGAVLVGAQGRVDAVDPESVANAVRELLRRGGAG